MVESRSSLLELAALFCKLGAIGFGGPATHIAMLESEVVTRRQWLSADRFVDLVGLTNLVPGPSSTEVAIYIGYLRAGWLGLLVAGVCFIAPAMAIVSLLAIGYERYGQLPQAIAIFANIKPIVAILTLQAVWKLGRSALKSNLTRWVGGISIGAFGIYNLNILLVLFAAGFGVMLWQNRQSWRGGFRSLWVPLLDFPTLAILPAIAERPHWLDVFGLFLKIGATLYGGGYVLLAFLQPELVDRTQWLTSSQLLDAIAIGQITPGPLFTTATFIGYLLAGNVGAIAATIGIFLPSFGFIALLTRFAPQLRRSIWFGSWLDGVNAGAWGTIAVVAYRSIVDNVWDLKAVAIAAISALLIWRWRIDPLWPILGSAAIGLVGQLVRYQL